MKRFKLFIQERRHNDDIWNEEKERWSTTICCCRCSPTVTFVAAGRLVDYESAVTVVAPQPSLSWRHVGWLTTNLLSLQWFANRHFRGNIVIFCGNVSTTSSDLCILFRPKEPPADADNHSSPLSGRWIQNESSRARRSGGEPLDSE